MVVGDSKKPLATGYGNEAQTSPYLQWIVLRFDSQFNPVSPGNRAYFLLSLIQWNPAITKCHGSEKNVRYSARGLRYSEDPVITNYLVNN